MSSKVNLVSNLATLFACSYLVLFFSTGLAFLAEVLPWVTLFLCLTLSVSGFVMSLWAFSKGENGFKLSQNLLTATVCFVLVVFTGFVFFMSEGGFSPLIGTI
ncbi:hypothetical protein DH09_19900 [Bacillaceae bacterium JMAK1]|nr:hypothetical protein DH09_19900 [Bacillaceae bacterium JMAK1]